MKPLSTLAQSVRASTTMAIDTQFKKMRAEGIDVIGFSVGEPDFPTPERIKQAGIRDVGAYFSVQDAEKELAAWSDRLTVSSRGYMLGYQPIRGPGIRPIHRLLARIADGPMKLKIVRMEFQEGSR